MTRHRRLPSSVQLLLSIVAAIGGLLLLSQMPDARRAEAHPSPPFTDGAVPTSAACSDFFFEFIGFIHIDVPDAGWVPVNKGNPGFPKFVSATGEVTKSRITYTDYPDVHDSHDHNIDIFLDPGQESLLSEVNGDHDGDTVPDSLEVEWEAGILPNEFSGDGSAHYFPKWAWPNVGDRVWSDGHWIFDCGHPEDVAGEPHAKTEIHPARGVASMRQQMQTLPGSGATPVPVTATDLYIHGRSGVVTDILECGQEVVLGTGSCTTPFGAHNAVTDHLGTAIDDNFAFDVCLPPLPFDKAVPAYSLEDGPGNTIPVAPDLDFVASTGACAADPAKFGPMQLHVAVPLDGTGVTPDDVYARRINAGWVFPAENLRHLKLTLNLMDLHDDKEPPGFDCECTFFWMNVDRAPGGEWIRLADHANGNMNDYDDDAGLGDGEMGFSGAEFDFYVGNDMPYTVRAHGYDGGFGDTIPGADCFDDHFGHHDFGAHVDLSIFPPALPDFCYVLLAIDPSIPDNDDFAQLGMSFNPADYLGSKDVTANGEYELEFNVEEIPLTAEEDGADLSITKDCKPDEGALAGVRFTCSILVFNGGPGLPTNVVVDDVLLTDVDPSKYTLEPPTFTFAGVTGITDPCVTPDTPIEEIPGGKEFKCEIGTVPIGGKAIITSHITSTEGGDFNNFARVSSDSGDADLTNNESADGVHVTAVADLGITKSGSEDPLTSGTELTYTLEIANDGPSTAVNVLAEDFLPDGVAVVSVSGTGGASCLLGVPGDVTRPTTCNFDTMAPGDTETMTIVVTVLPGNHNFLHNDARVSSDTLDLDNSDNVDSENTVVQVADLQITKTSEADAYKASPTVVYTLTVQNNGPADAHDVVVTDDLPVIKQDRVFWSPFLDCSKPPGGTLLTCALGTIPAGGTKTVTVMVVFKGSRGVVSNTADVTSTTFDHALANNSSTKTILVGALPKP